MTESPAINTSPLIFLSKANLLNLLQIVSPQIIVPEAVATEIQAYGETDLTARTLAATDWLVVIPTPLVPAVIQSWDLGAGESAALTWGYTHPGTEVILDDLAGRRCATTLGIPVRGTMGLVLTAKQRGEISAARPVLEQLRLSGMYLSDQVMNQALALPAFLTKGAIANSRNLTRQGFKPIYSPPVAQNSVLRLQASE